MVGIRELRADEVSFLKDMLYAAIAWNPERQLPLPKAELLDLPQLRIFHEDWGREGDTALVAELDGQPVGLVWYRFFTEDVHGEGFVDEATPEVAIAVVEGQRGNGIGAALMYLGYSINDPDPAHLEEAKNLLIEQSKCVKAYDSQTNDDLIISGETALALIWIPVDAKASSM